MNQKITIVIAVFNGEKTIKRTVDSVMSQSYKNKQVIVMDGGSTDGTVKILQGYDGESLYWSSEIDRGIAHAWNKSISLINEGWVIFIGSDDYLASDTVLTEISNSLEECYDIIHGNIVLRSEGCEDKVLGEEWNKAKFNRRMSIAHPATFHSYHIFEEFGLYSEKFKIAMDYELLLRGKKLKYKYIDSIITIMTDGGISSRLYGRSLFESYKAQRKNGGALPYSLFWFIAYYIKIKFKL